MTETIFYKKGHILAHIQYIENQKLMFMSFI